MENKSQVEIANVVETDAVIAYTNPGNLLAIAVQKDFDVDRLSKLMELQERWEKNEARKSFHVAMAEFKKNPPEIVKDAMVNFGNTHYSHATLGNVVKAITKALSEHDLSINWNTETKENVTVTCTVTHIAGHSESTTITAPADKSGSKNAIQAIGSTITYLQRYTLLAICGLATNEFEDDGRSYGQGSKPPTNLQKLIDEVTAHKDKLPEQFKADVRKVASEKKELSAENLQEWLDAIKQHVGNGNGVKVAA
jgi:hypothetical protein